MSGRPSGGRRGSRLIQIQGLSPRADKAPAEDGHGARGRVFAQPEVTRMDYASTYRIVPRPDGRYEIIQTYPGGGEAVFTPFLSEATARRWLRGRLTLLDEAALGRRLENKAG